MRLSEFNEDLKNHTVLEKMQTISDSDLKAIEGKIICDDIVGDREILYSVLLDEKEERQMCLQRFIKDLPQIRKVLLFELYNGNLTEYVKRYSDNELDVIKTYYERDDIAGDIVKIYDVIINEKQYRESKRKAEFEEEHKAFIKKTQ